MLEKLSHFYQFLPSKEALAERLANKPFSSERFLFQVKNWVRNYAPFGSHLPEMPPDFVSKIIEYQEKLKPLSSEAFREESLQMREKLRHEKEEDFIGAFALVREAARRILGYEHYPVQLEAGYYLCHQAIAEMAPGEGKTLAATLPAYFRSATERSVHVVTVNPYLAERDFQALQPLYDLLGVTVGCLISGAPSSEKQKAYACEIIYGPGYEFGFDYLRDQLTLLNQRQLKMGQSFRETLLKGKSKQPLLLQKRLAWAIIDEVDSVLVDEARSPLVISAGARLKASQPEIYRQAYQVANELGPEDLTQDKKRQTIKLTPQGKEKVHEKLSQLHRYHLRRPWDLYVECALRAKYFFERDVQYVVASDQIQIVDEYTGRRFRDRTWREGLHQAIEAKENITITEETESAASITRQRFYRLYQNLSGMTGTAEENQREFFQVYGLPIAKIPFHRPSQREIFPELLFSTSKHKMDAVIQEIKEMHAQGRPVLVGTRTIVQSEAIGEALTQEGIPYRLLNAKQDKKEAEIVAEAGNEGAITIATNMAGRGTHITLPESVLELGGLHVIGIERHESRRIDRQLIGRGARQGQPGSAHFFNSSEDFLLSQHAPEIAEKFQALPSNDEGTLESQLIEKINQIQRKVEKQYEEWRAELLRRDHWLEETRRLS